MDNVTYPQFYSLARIRWLRNLGRTPILQGMTHYSSEINTASPGFLMSNLPGTFGYHPADCFVLFFLHRSPIGPALSRYELGPILRLEYEALDSKRDFLALIADFEPDLMLSVFIGGEQAITAARICDELCSAHGVPMAAVWHLNELHSGARYRRVGGDEAPTFTPGHINGAEWDEGTVSEIVAAPAMEAFRRNGELPDLSREESLAFFSADPAGDNDIDPARFTKRARGLAKSWLQALDRSDQQEAEHMVDALLDDFQDAIDEVISYQLSVDDVVGNHDTLERCGVYYAHTRLRDTLLSWAVSDYANAFFTLSVAIARASKGETRANALCCAAFAASYSGRSYRVPQALQMAHTERSKHRLTLLMLEALQCGGLELLWRACIEGADLARDALLRS